MVRRRQLRPDRFAARVFRVGPGPVLAERGFQVVERRVFGMVLDRASGTAAWTFAATTSEADATLRSWAAARERAEAVGNPYEPAWKEPGALSPDKRRAQDELRALYRREARRRGPLVEAQREIEKLRDEGALFAVSHSGGKDSQAMAILVSELVPADQIVWIHAPLQGVEWAGIIDQVERYRPSGVELLFAEALDKHGEQKWLLERVLERGNWPSKGQRWCTSDFKRGPLRREIRRYADEHGYTTIVEAWGLRAEESGDRATQPTFEKHPDEYGKKSQRLGKKRRWYRWLPIKWKSTPEVFSIIEGAGQQPMWTYLEGMSRASCAFCILASIPDLRVAAKLAPDLYAMYVAVERFIGKTIKSRKPRKSESKAELRRQGKLGTSKKGSDVVLVPLEEVTGIQADPRLVEQHIRQIEQTGELRDLPVAGEAAYRKFKRSRAKRPAALRVLPVSQFGQLELWP